MSRDLFPFFSFPKPTLTHLIIQAEPRRVGAVGRGAVGTSRREVERHGHSLELRQHLAAVEREFEEQKEERRQDGLPDRIDLLLHLESAAGHPLTADQIDTLGAHPYSVLQALPLRNADGAPYTRVVLHVPFGDLANLAAKFRRYGEELTAMGKVPTPWVANLQSLSRAAVTALWTEEEPMPTDSEPRWWQLWFRREGLNLGAIRDWAKGAGLEIQTDVGQLMFFAERVVILARGTRPQLESSLDLLNCLAEIRSAPPLHYELNHLTCAEQEEWIAEARSRVTLPSLEAPAVCLLDTGVNRGHPLLQDLLDPRDNQTVLPQAGANDCYPGTGHGTPMAGLAAYGDLRDLLHSAEPWVQTHRLESVRTFDPSNPIDPPAYGAITTQAVASPETIAPRRKRVFSLAISARGDINGRPSAWSAAIDKLAFGAEEAGEPKRLFCIAVGNVDPTSHSGYAYSDTNERSLIEDPAQAWNAITVGASTRLDQVRETDLESTRSRRVAARGCLSPFSRTSVHWDPHWPIKPEIVMEGGNVVRTPTGDLEKRDSLQLVSTSATVQGPPLTAMCATSPATALASRLAAQIQATYPTLWPESVRALLVNSARWTENMLDGLEPHRRYETDTRQRFIQLLRTCGYGEPDTQRALFSSQRAVTILREDTLTPYEGTAGSARLRDCHIHHLRLPTDSLRAAGAATCTLKVTLSYFAAPNPSASNAVKGSRYRYGGCLLRFRVRHKDESTESFLSRVSIDAADDEDDLVARPLNLTDDGWALGHRLRDKGGSLVQDIWSGNAADLAQMDQIAIYPVKGWWAFKRFGEDSPWHNCHLRTLRYSLVVSLEIEAEVELYNQIRNLLPVLVDA